MTASPHDERSDRVVELFCDAVENFPAEFKEEARQLLAEWQAALHLVREIEAKGLEALL